MRNTWFSRAAPAVFLAFVCLLPSTGVEATTLSRLIRQLSNYGGRFYLTQVDSGVELSRRLVGQRLRSQAEYLRLMRAIESGRLSPSEVSRLSREVHALDREAQRLLKGGESVVARFAAHETAALRAGFALEDLSSWLRSARFFPSAPLRGSLMSARKELLAAGRLVPDEQAAGVFRLAGEKQKTLLELASASGAGARRIEKFRGTIPLEAGGVAEVEATLTFRPANVGPSRWVIDTRVPVRVTSPAWGPGKVVELHYFASKPRFVISGSLSPTLGTARAYQDFLFIGQFAEAERPLETVVRISGRRRVTPDGDELVDFAGSAMEIQSGALRTGLD